MSDTFIDPTKESFAAFKELPRDKPVDMLNLVRLREKAAYEDGREATGAEAYKAYGEHSAPIFQGVGGKIVWRAAPELTLIGPSDEAWHVSFVARYPDAQAFLDMVYNPDYQAIVFHRQAAVQTSRLIRTFSQQSDGAFG